MFRFDRQRARCRTAALLASAMLAACAVPQSVLPPSMRKPAPPTQVTANLPPPPRNGAPPAAATSAAGAASTPAAVASPVRSPSSVVVTPLPTPSVPPAIAARFPEPAVSFATPAFDAGRTAFTTNAELGAVLRRIERGNTLGEHATDVNVLSLGVSQLGDPIEAIAFTRPPPSPAVAHRPTVVLIAGQHGDEPAGTEALIVVMQELASGRLANILERLDVVVLARANPDGAAAFTRNAADGTDVNRDHLLLNSPEARAIAKLMVDVAPIVVLDLHEYPVTPAFTAKFGGVQRFDALIQYATVANLPAFVTKAAEEWFRVPLIAGLRGAGMSVDWYSTMSTDPSDRTLTMGSVGPQVGRNTSGLRNAVSLLVETRGGGMGRVDLKRRVNTHVTAVANVLTSAARHADDLVKLRQFVERDTIAQACRGDVVLEAAPTPSEYTTQVLDPTTGDVRRLTVSWQSALQLRALKTKPRPCGYWLAESETEAVRRLRLLGIDVQRLDELGELRGESYRLVAREPLGPDAAASSPGAATRLKVQTLPTLLDVPIGSYYVSLEQPLANLAVAVLDPESPAGFAANGVITDVEHEARILSRPEIRATAIP
ncbi:MAG TPA: M14 family metallocarboxypeptidase [Caldimonas sp.]|nr:M14 family metallocarboxypeptidase [Caldimonas sp.]